MVAKSTGDTEFQSLGEGIYKVSRTKAHPRESVKGNDMYIVNFKLLGIFMVPCGFRKSTNGKPKERWKLSHLTPNHKPPYPS